MEEECATKISQLESKHNEQFGQFETEFKELVLKVSTEEIKHLSNVFQKHFDDVSETMTRLRNELEHKTRLVRNLSIFSSYLTNSYKFFIIIFFKGCSF